jgi:hypothetical protein
MTHARSSAILRRDPVKDYSGGMRGASTPALPARLARGMGLAGVWVPCGVLLAFAVVLFVVGAVRSWFE